MVLTLQSDFSSVRDVLLNEACGKDELRPDLTFIYFTDEAAIATNAHIYIEVPYADTPYSPEFIATVKGFRMSSRQFTLIANQGVVHLDPDNRGIIALDYEGLIRLVLEPHDGSVVRTWQNRISGIEQQIGKGGAIESVRLSNIMLGILCKVFHQAYLGFVFHFDKDAYHTKVEVVEHPNIKVIIMNMVKLEAS